MTRKQFIRLMGKSSELTPTQLEDALKAFEYAINEVIATTDTIQLEFGKIEGIVRFPQKSYGGDTQSKIKDAVNDNWQLMKIGFPRCEFSIDTKLCRAVHPRVWFNYLENRYTPEAERFFKDVGLPIPKQGESLVGIEKMPKDVKEAVDAYLKRSVQKRKRLAEMRRRQEECTLKQKALLIENELRAIGMSPEFIERKLREQNISIRDIWERQKEANRKSMYNRAAKRLAVSENDLFIYKMEREARIIKLQEAEAEIDIDLLEAQLKAARKKAEEARRKAEDSLKRIDNKIDNQLFEDSKLYLSNVS